MENTCPNSPTTHRHYGTRVSLTPNNQNKTKDNNQNKHHKNTGSKSSILTLLGKLSKSKSKSSSRSQSPFPSPSPYSASSTPPQQGSTTAPRLSSPLSPPTSTSLVSINLKPAEYVRRIKRLLAHSRKAPPSPLSTSSHPPSPIHHVERNTIQYLPQSNDIIASIDNDLRRQSQILPTQTTTFPNHPNIIHNNDNNTNNDNENNDNTDNNNNNENPTHQNQTRASSSPLLPPFIQPPGLLLTTPPTSKESRFLKTFLRSSPPRPSIPLTPFNIATLQAELDGRPGVAGFGARDVSKPNPLGEDGGGGDDYDELLELGRSARAAGRADEEQSRSREKLVGRVEKWLGGVEVGVEVEKMGGEVKG
ncbi:hypothetical protein ACJ72_05005 [Emergomyces africanus]|uniref:Uncharacterized protein n=1 Tax=Emergomyces africanus TaxID=1955775 RepID=A0A1B7NV47_9EURO|nr:hypothetical protein ACJ72_05005 [Emergomyces africanus]